ncbi:coil containing protein [Vibrio phage 1.135.O._10N.222.54.B6]|nr:coil containing protein [Vibrio phage 1.135.O._10N.222.54.B6]
MIEVKMSDVFNLPVGVRGDLIFFSKSDTCYVKVESVLSRKEELEVSSAIRRAVNNHDRLQQENAELRSFVKKVLELDIETFHFETQGVDEDCFEYVCTDIVDDAVELLAKLNQQH